MNICNLKSFSVVFAAALILTPIAGICADPGSQVRVSFAYANLSNPQGIATLYTRLQRAAAEVCGHEPENRELSRHAAWYKCFGPALDDAVAQVRSIGLATLHAKRVGRTSQLLAAKSTPDER
jgi:UrcA family protein